MAFLVSLAIWVPCALITKRSDSVNSPKFFSKTIRSPSGDQAGTSSTPGSLVRRLAPDPSGFMTHRSPANGVLHLVNAILVPSGDQDGTPPLVSLTGSVPSALTTKISGPCPPSLTNAIFFPSGDQDGKKSPPVDPSVIFGQARLVGVDVVDTVDAVHPVACDGDLAFDGGPRFADRACRWSRGGRAPSGYGGNQQRPRRPIERDACDRSPPLPDLAAADEDVQGRTARKAGLTPDWVGRQLIGTPERPASPETRHSPRAPCQTFSVSRQARVVSWPSDPAGGSRLRIVASAPKQQVLWSRRVGPKSSQGVIGEEGPPPANQSAREAERGEAESVRH